MNRYFVKHIKTIFGPTVEIESVKTKTHEFAKVSFYGTTDFYSWNPISNSLVPVPASLLHIILNAL